MQAIEITNVKIRLMKSDRDPKRVGFASCVVCGAIYLNDIEIRRMESGELGIEFPSHVSPRGMRYFVFAPADEEARAAISAVVLDRLQELIA